MTMTTNIKNLNRVRNRKKLLHIKQDLDHLLYLVKLTKAGFEAYTIYTPIKSIYKNICENEYVLEHERQKILFKLEKLENEEN